ncbi:tail fiber assembly protein [Providencia rettgeri]|uniref:tail fiber assembly protein n=1 Tax=Providencia rettgeri TaxID=587 RepID=UPI001F043879|nr:tail fiber assembly protein [Providencia rettgeri]MCG9941622.1 tail fiber assembly protein [Providencia rettgeri]
MNYLKKNKTGEVFAYTKADITQVERLTELEQLINEKEPVFIQASDNLNQAELDLNNAKALLNKAIANQPIIDGVSDNDEDDEITPVDNKDDEEIQRLTLLVDDKTAVYDSSFIEFTKIESEYQSLKIEYTAILPVFFDIRENLKEMKKMSQKDIDAHLNPPIPKEQLIAEAEQQKKFLLVDANNAIAPLQDAVDFGTATDNEITLLGKWKEYRIAINRIDTSTAPDIEWPVKP